MDPDLFRRYAALLYAYGAGETGFLPHIKRRITLEPNLRPDAALCLLTLYDQMILRPYVGYIPTPDEQEGLPRLKWVEGMKPNDFGKQVDDTLDAILSHMRNMRTEKQSTSHDVLQAITSVWAQLKEIFLWG